MTVGVETIVVEVEVGAMPPVSIDTFFGFVSDANHEADLTEEGVAKSFAA